MYPNSPKEAAAEAKKMGISGNALFRARKELGVETYRVGGVWKWKLENLPPPAPKDELESENGGENENKKENTP